MNGGRYLSFDHVAPIYEATRYIPPECLRLTAQIIRDDGKFLPGDVLLDAGTGTGRFARHLSAAGIPVVGVDIARQMLDVARRESPPLPLVRGDLRALPMRPGSVAGALLVHILHLIADWTRVLAEVRRVLLPGAPLYLGNETGKHFISRTIFFEIAGERGLTQPHLGAATFHAILDQLAATGAELTPIDAGRLQWTARIRMGEMLEILRSNPYSQFWQIPPAEYAALMRETERRIRSRFDSLDTLDEAPASISLWRAAWP